MAYGAVRRAVLRWRIAGSRYGVRAGLVCDVRVWFFSSHGTTDADIWFNVYPKSGIALRRVYGPGTDWSHTLRRLSGTDWYHPTPIVWCGAEIGYAATGAALTIGYAATRRNGRRRMLLSSYTPTGTQIAHGAVCLRAPYAMSGNPIAHRAICLRLPYVMSGTELAYRDQDACGEKPVAGCQQPGRAFHTIEYGAFSAGRFSLMLFGGMVAACLCCYETICTGVGCTAVRCLVLQCAVLLPGPVSLVLFGEVRYRLEH
eukprot:3747133-Rhodomonas_salina.2